VISRFRNFPDCLLRIESLPSPFSTWKCFKKLLFPHSRLRLPPRRRLPKEIAFFLFSCIGWFKCPTVKAPWCGLVLCVIGKIPLILIIILCCLISWVVLLQPLFSPLSCSSPPNKNPHCTRTILSYRPVVASDGIFPLLCVSTPLTPGLDSFYPPISLLAPQKVAMHLPVK